MQVADVTVFRNSNKDFKREGDARDTGLFGINQHWGYYLPCNDLGNSSAGCLVGRTTAGRHEFMRLVKSAWRFVVSNGAYRFITTILPANALPYPLTDPCQFTSSSLSARAAIDRTLAHGPVSAERRRAWGYHDQELISRSPRLSLPWR